MSLKKPVKIFFAFFIIWTWIFVGVPQVWPFGVWKENETRLPPQVREAGALSASSGDGLIVYSSTTTDQPSWRSYSNTNNNFGSASGTVAGTTNGTSYRIVTSPLTQEAIAVFVSSTSLYVICYDGTNWSSEWSDTTVNPTNPGVPFDVAYETSSGDAIVLYGNGGIGTNQMSYRTKSGTSGCGAASWTASSTLTTANAAGTYPISWVRLASDRRSTSTLVAAIWSDYNRILSGQVWSGAAWSNEPTTALETNLETAAGVACTVSGTTNCSRLQDFDLDFESGGDLMIVWANVSGLNGTNGAYYATCTGGTSSCSWSSTSTIASLLDDAQSLDISANPNSDEIVFASIGAQVSDLQAAYWDGSTWTGTPNLDENAQTSGVAFSKMVSTGWLISGATTRSVIIYADASPFATSTSFITGNGSTFTSSTPFQNSPGYNAAHRWYDIQTDPINKDRLMFTISDNASDLFAKRLTMDSTPTFSWTNSDGSSALELNLVQTVKSPFVFAYWRALNSIPIVSATTLNSGSSISLTENTSTTISVTATITDLNGSGDISYATSVIYRSGVGANCTVDDNNCYRISSSACTLSSCSGNSCSVTCSAKINFFADPTDASSTTYSAQNWLAEVSGFDASGVVGSSSASGVELNTLQAIDITPILYIGGGFDQAGGKARNKIAAIDTNTATATTWNPNINDTVRSNFVINGSTLYAGGDFTAVGGVTRNRIAAIDLLTGSTTSWDPNANGIVRAMVLSPDGSTLYVGGDFTAIGGVQRNRIAAVNTTTGSSTSWNASSSASVYTLALTSDGNTLYAGGPFLTIGSQSRTRLASLDTVAGSSSNWNPNMFGGDVWTMAISSDDKTLYVGGDFTGVNGGLTAARNRLAAFDISSSVGSSTSWNPNSSGAIRGMLLTASSAYIGGGFTIMGGVARNRIAEVDLINGSITSWDPGADSTVRTFAMHPDGTIVYVTGDFSQIGGQYRYNTAAIDISTGLSTSWFPYPNNSVFSSVLGNVLNFGNINAGSDSSGINKSVLVLNTGNSAIDSQLSGTNLTAGANSIDVSNLKYATSSFTYSSCTVCSALSTSPTTLELDLLKPTSTTSIIDDIFWGLSVPNGSKGGIYSGTNTFTVITD